MGITELPIIIKRVEGSSDKESILIEMQPDTTAEIDLKITVSSDSDGVRIEIHPDVKLIPAEAS